MDVLSLSVNHITYLCPTALTDKVPPACGPVPTPHMVRTRLRQPTHSLVCVHRLGMCRRLSTSGRLRKRPAKIADYTATLSVTLAIVYKNQIFIFYNIACMQ